MKIAKTGERGKRGIDMRNCIFFSFLHVMSEERLLDDEVH